MLCAMSRLPDPFRIIAHRGASGYAPENTMAAFARARDMGCTEVETDVHFSRDGRLVLLHDDDLDRTTDGTGRPGARDWADLRRLDAGSWFSAEFAGEPLITLDELLAAFGDAFLYHVELKDGTPGIGAATAAVLAAHGLAHRAFVTGFDRDAELRAARSAAGGLRSCVLVPTRQDPAAALDAAAAAGHDAASLHVDACTPERVARGRAAGLEVRAWGVRDRGGMARAAEAGVHGVTINWPDWLQDWVARRG